MDFEMKYWLTQFEGGGDGGDGGDGGSGGDGKDGKDGSNANDGGKKSGGKDKEPFAIFPDEESFMSRVGREAKKQVNALLKDLGFEKIEDLKAVITAHNENAEKNKTELQKATEAAEKANKKVEETLSKANKSALTSEAKIQALALGVDPSKVNHVLKLAEFDDVKIEDGDIKNPEAVKKAIEAVLTDLPELVGKPGTRKAGNDFSDGDKDKGGDKALSMEVIKNMSVEEAQRRMPEINEFLAKNKNK